MFEEDLKAMSAEEREDALEWMELFLEDVAIGNGDFLISDGKIVFED